MNFTSQFGERLKAERKRLGLSQADAAIKAGVSREMFGKYESANENKTSLPGATVLAALDYMGADVLYILTGREGRKVSENSNQYRTWTSEELQQEVVRLLADMEIDDAGQWLDTARHNANRARRARLPLPTGLSAEEAVLLSRFRVADEETLKVLDALLADDEERRNARSISKKSKKLA